MAERVARLEERVDGLVERGAGARDDFRALWRKLDDADARREQHGTRLVALEAGHVRLEASMAAMTRAVSGDAKTGEPGLVGRMDALQQGLIDRAWRAAGVALAIFAALVVVIILALSRGPDAVGAVVERGIDRALPAAPGARP